MCGAGWEQHLENIAAGASQAHDRGIAVGYKNRDRLGLVGGRGDGEAQGFVGTNRDGGGQRRESHQDMVLEGNVVGSLQGGNNGGGVLDSAIVEVRLQQLAGPEQAVGGTLAEMYRSEEHTSELQSLRHL